MEQQPSGCLGFFLRLFGIKPGKAKNDLPYRLRDDFLSPAELSFYRVLEQAVGDQFKVNTKVRIGDLLFVPRHEGSQGFTNKIDRKHVDFLLCDPTTVRPLLVIELDDASHNRPDRQERDRFVDQAFAAAGLPILHVKAKRAYSVADIKTQVAGSLSNSDNRQPPQPQRVSSAVPNCPSCDVPMAERTAGKGKNTGKRFWGCTRYPKCREIIGID